MKYVTLPTFLLLISITIPMARGVPIAMTSSIRKADETSTSSTPSKEELIKTNSEKMGKLEEEQKKLSEEIAKQRNETTGLEGIIRQKDAELDKLRSEFRERENWIGKAEGGLASLKKKHEALRLRNVLAKIDPLVMETMSRHQKLTEEKNMFETRVQSLSQNKTKLDDARKELLDKLREIEGSNFKGDPMIPIEEETDERPLVESPAVAARNEALDGGNAGAGSDIDREENLHGIVIRGVNRSTVDAKDERGDEDRTQGSPVSSNIMSEVNSIRSHSADSEVSPPPSPPPTETADDEGPSSNMNDRSTAIPEESTSPLQIDPDSEPASNSLRGDTQKTMI